MAPNAAADNIRTTANLVAELTFSSSRVYTDPFNQVSLDVLVVDPAGTELRVPAFWAGNNLWKARYASPLVGIHLFHSKCSEPQDTGLEGRSGEIRVEPNTSSNPFYLHGPLSVASNRRYLEHADHTPFFWLGDTWWMGLCQRLRWPDEFQSLTSDRRAKGFNVIQIVAGLYPDMPPFDPRGANETGFPWEADYARIRPEYFDAADRRLGYLVAQGFAPCIVGAWGYFMPWMGVEKMKAHWRYLIARYGAWPVIWCIAGEANLPWYLAKGFPYDDRKQVHDWTEVMRFVRTTDPFHRPVTIHPTAIKQYTSRHATDDPGLLDFDMLQTPHGQREAVPVTITAVRQSYEATPRLPVIDGEASYEMLNDNLPTEWTRRMFWLCMMNGAAGHTYGANGIWQCNRAGQPHGKSPHGGSYGRIPWNEAMNLPGSRQLGLAKSLFERYPWHKFEPHPEWALARRNPPVDLEGCSWIWFPEGEPAKNAPAAKRFFRRSFVLPETQVTRAALRFSADDWFAASLNGQLLGANDNWRYARQFDVLADSLKKGTNFFTIVAENKPTSAPANPAGLIGCLEINFMDGQNLRIATDSTWRCSTNEVPGWDKDGFDDVDWRDAQPVVAYGDGPWGRMAQPDETSFQPQATGIPDRVRIIYVPENEAIQVRELGAKARYDAAYFNPASGQKSVLGMVEADDNGNWACLPPTSEAHDWVVVLEAPARER